MPLNKAFITTFLLSATFLSSEFCIAQGKKDSRTRPALPYGHKVVAPPGMTYIQGGVTTINYDQSTTDTNSARKVSVTSFFMDKTEVTNQEYREFTEWVADSIAIVKYLRDEKYFLPDNQGTKSGTNGNMGASTTTTSATPAPVPADTARPMFDTSGFSGGPRTTPVITDNTQPAASNTMPANDSAIKNRRIDWSKVDHDKLWNDADNKSKLAAMLDENGNIKKDQYIFSYKHIKNVSSAKHNAKGNEYVTETLNVYPNENCWAEDLTNAQTDLYVENYFKVPPFDDYPVVGVSWLQARAFCHWRTMTAHNYYNMPEYMKYYHFTYTLPSEAQWVYAAQSFYEMIYAGNKYQDTLDTSMAAINAAVEPPMPVDSTTTPHDSLWVAQYIAAHTHHNTAGVVDTPKSAAQMQKEQRVAEYERKLRRAQNGNLYVLDYIKLLNFLQNGFSDGNQGPIVDSTYIHRDPNGMLANFKQEEGDYWEDGAALTTPVMSFAPNEFGLYNMEGNVAEWVMDAYSPSAFSFVSDINPQLYYDADSTDADVMKRKVVRGGSFMSNAKSLSPYYRDMELQHFSHCFLGFRCVVEAPEIVTKNTATRNRTKRGKPTPGKISGIRLPDIH